jgi:hypothetical protein
MPSEITKEVAKIAIETSGTFSHIWEIIVSGIGIVLAGMWAHITGRLKKVEEGHVTAQMLKQHLDDENDKFRELFSKHDGVIEAVSDIRAAVARIEGKLSQ